MSERRITLDAAAFLDSPHARALHDAPAADVREIVQRFLAACYTDLAKAPRLVEGEELGELLGHTLARRYARRDRLADATESVLAAYLDHLDETAVVPYAYELRQALAEHAAAFRACVQSGAALEGGVVRRPQPTVRHRADKTGRNDPCPCGSGRKFKKCCGKLGGADS